MSASRRLLAIFIVTVFLPLSSFSSDKNLDSLIRIALNNFPRLKALEYSKESAEYFARSAGSLPNPMLTLGAVNLPISSFSMTETPMSGVQVGISQNLPWFGKLGKKKEIAIIDRDISIEREKKLKLSVSKIVAHNYYDFLFYKDMITIVSEKIEYLELLESSTQAKYTYGKGKLESVLRIKTIKEKLRNLIVSYNHNLNSAKENLTYLTNYYGIESFLTRKNLEIDKFTVWDNSFQHMTNHPALRITELSLSKAEMFYELKKKDLYPNFTVSLDYRIRKFIPSDPIMGDDFISAKIGMTLPFLFGGSEKNIIKSAQREMKSREFLNIEARSGHLKEMKILQSQLESISQQLSNYESNILPTSENMMKVVYDSYEQNQSDFKNVYDVLNEYFDFKIENLQLKRSYLISQARYNEIFGIGL